MENPHIALLNRRLGESLGLVCGGSLPRFAWKWAPDMPWFVYGRDGRTLIKKCWADSPSPVEGGVIGKSWVLAEWRLNRNEDHKGYGTSCPECGGTGRTASGTGFKDCHTCGGERRIYGIRIAVTGSAGYAPYFETALAPGVVPSEKLNQNYIWALRQQLAASAEFNPNSFDNHLAEAKYESDKMHDRNTSEWVETALGQYDSHVGAFGNCEPGTAGGFMSFGGV